jgi:hypothetical protein
VFDDQLERIRRENTIVLLEKTWRSLHCIFQCGREISSSPANIFFKKMAVKWLILSFILASRLFHLLARMDHCLRLVPLPVVNNTRKQCPSRRSARNIDQGLAASYISHKSIRLSSLSPSLNFRITLSKMEFQKSRRAHRIRAKKKN